MRGTDFFVAERQQASPVDHSCSLCRKPIGIAEQDEFIPYWICDDGDRCEWCYQLIYRQGNSRFR